MPIEPTNIRTRMRYLRKVMKLKHLLCVLTISLVAPHSMAEDGLVIQLTISEQAEGANDKRDFTTSVLMKFDEEVSIDLSDWYVLKVRSRPNGEQTVDLLVTLKDIVEGKPYYVGADAVTLKIGESTDMSFNNYQTEYSISLDTSFGKLPDPDSAREVGQ